MRSAVGVGLFASYSAQSPVRGVRSQGLDRIVSLALIRARTRTSLLAGAPESERALALAVALDLAPDLVLAELTRDLDPELDLVGEPQASWPAVSLTLLLCEKS